MPKAQQHWSLTRFMTTLTAKTFLSTILASPAPICQPGFFIFPLSESKLFLSFIWLYDSCPPVPSKILFSRIQIFTSQSVFIYFFLILCSTEGPASTFGQKGETQRYTMQAISGRLFTRAASSCHRKLQRGELQREIGSASTEHRVTEPANFSVKSPPAEHTYLSHFLIPEGTLDSVVLSVLGCSSRVNL